MKVEDIDPRCRQLQHVSIGVNGAGGRYLVQLNLNSLGSCFFSFVPNASDGLLEYGLLEAFASREVGRAFSSVTSFPVAPGPLRDVNGKRNGGIAEFRYESV